MARKGQTIVDFDNSYFDEIMKSAGVAKLTDSKANEALQEAKRTAPVDEGDYRDGLMVVKRDTRYRHTARVIGEDAKTLLIEARTGNLARALKNTKR